MADGAEEVAVRRAGEEVEIIPATLQRPSLHQDLAGIRLQPLLHSYPAILSGEVGHRRAQSRGLESAPTFREKI
jgi:hypothetical protein